MKRSWVLVGMLLAGCSTTTSADPRPTLIGNNYYMASDSGCAFYKLHPTNTKIFCYNDKRQPMGERFAMTPQQMAVYQQVQQGQAPKSQLTMTTCSPLGNSVNCMSY